MLPRNSYHLKTKFSGHTTRGANALIGLIFPMVVMRGVHDTVAPQLL